MKPIHKRLTCPQLIVYIGKLMFDRGLTDISGGNISIREGDDLYFSPTHSGQSFHWRLDSNDIVLGEMDGFDKLINNPLFTREGLSHLKIYDTFPFVGGIIHAHPKYLNPFIAESKPIPPILKSSEHYGILRYHDEADEYSEDQAQKIVKALLDQEEGMRDKGAAVLMPRHGIIVASTNIMKAIDCLDRINNNAFAYLCKKLI